MTAPIAEIVQALIGGLGSAEAVAEQVAGVTTRSVQRHAEGTRTPNATIANRYVALHSKRHEKVAEEPARPAFDASRPTLEAVTNAAVQAEEILTKAMRDPDASYRDKAGAIHALTRTLRDLAKLRGELEPTEASILRTPAWARLCDEVISALVEHPAAAKSVIAALQALEGK